MDAKVRKEEEWIEERRGEGEMIPRVEIRRERRVRGLKCERKVSHC